MNFLEHNLFIFIKLIEVIKMVQDHRVKIVHDQKVNKAVKVHVVHDRIVVQDRTDRQDVNKKAASRTLKAAWLPTMPTTQTQVSDLVLSFILMLIRK